MPNKLTPFSFFTALVFATGLMACTGMSPGGGAPAEVAQGGGPVAIGNSLDAGGGTAIGGSPIGGGGSSGEAVPSTQQSTDAIGAPCVIRFKVVVKALKNGVEEACIGSTARMRPLDQVDLENGELEPPDITLNPNVTMVFTFEPGDSPFNATKTHSTSCVEGRWLADQEFMFRYPGKDLTCDNYQISAYAFWNRDNKLYSSQPFLGPPVPERDEDYAVPLELTLDLGGGYNPVYNSAPLSNSVYSD